MSENIKVLISNDQIENRIKELAMQIDEDYKGKSIKLICILKGGVVFLVELAKKLKLHCSMDFMAVSSYGDSLESSGIVKILKDLDESITGQDVILVEDIIDSGKTLSHILNHIKSQNPNSVRLCTLLDKPSRRVVDDVSVDYVGFSIPDEFVVGFGLDYKQGYRNLDYVGVLSLD